ncbi:MAG: alkaline phosphatase [Leptolyngbya sp. Prado105]|nr:alkaline phosphatase [Leptolyngbya sp. Prado105]
MSNNHVIFIHPDGTSPAHYAAARFASQGPDGRLNWDTLSNAGVYLGHMKNQLTGTSNAGAVTHANGVKVYAESFGLDEQGNPVQSLSSLNNCAIAPGTTIMEEAVGAHKVTALINSGFIAEPGTGAFAAQTGSPNTTAPSFPRQNLAVITEQILESGVNFIMGGGELHMLPVGTTGRHVTAEIDARFSTGDAAIINRPQENLIEKAKSLGYTVVYTRDELFALLDPAKTSTPPQKVLGVFAAIHTFNDQPEEALAATNTPFYLPTAPTIGEMADVSQRLMEQHPNFGNGSLMVLEEEGTDNFGNVNNAPGTIEALLRADEAIGVALGFIERNPNTLLITAADSDAGGLQVVDRPAGQPVGTLNTNANADGAFRNPLDGQTGTNSQPFVAAPDASGDRFPFGIGWVGTPDFAGSIVSKAHGLNADKLGSTVDNTDIYRLMYETLFGTELPALVEAPTPAPQASQLTGNVIFIHPDGTSPAYYAAARFTDQGPDGRLNWDMMSNAGVYLGHMENQLTGTSNAGAVTHANGVKVDRTSYGLNPDGSLVTSLSGETGKTIMDEAREAGKATAIINSGFIAEPGSGAFLAKAPNRNNFANITEQIIRSGTNVILGGGELHMLPVGTTGRYVTAEVDAENRDPLERPTINLIDLAKSLGYNIVYTLDELKALPTDSEKVLGVFASENTYNDRTESELAAAGLGFYGQPNNPNPPTVADMLQETLRFVSTDQDGFFVVLEEEGTDNFGNDNNAGGAIEAVRRADAAMGVAMDFIRNHDPNTLLITAADSEAGGLQVYQPTPFAPGFKSIEDTVPSINVNPAPPATPPRNTLDGVNGNTAPWTAFEAKDSLAGAVGNFGIGWVGTPDFPGSIVSKTYGLNADLLPSTLDNTEIYRLMYQTLFGRRLSDLVDAKGGEKTIEITLDAGFRTVLNFSSGRSIASEADTLKFTGEGLTAENLRLTQDGDDLIVSFNGISNTGAVLKDVQFQDLFNVSFGATATSNAAIQQEAAAIAQSNGSSFTQPGMLPRTDLDVSAPIRFASGNAPLMTV